MAKLIFLVLSFIFGIHALFIEDPEDFELVVNDEVYALQYREGAYSKPPLNRVTDVAAARFQNVRGDVSRLKGVFWAPRSENYLSAVFDQDSPFAAAGEEGEEEAFPAAERILYVPLFDPYDAHLATVFMESQSQQNEPHLRAVGRSRWINTNPERRFHKFALIDAPDPQTVCEFNLVDRENVIVSLDEDWTAETGVELEAVTCRFGRKMVLKSMSFFFFFFFFFRN